MKIKTSMLVAAISLCSAFQTFAAESYTMRFSQKTVAFTCTETVYKIDYNGNPELGKPNGKVELVDFGNSFLVKSPSGAMAESGDVIKVDSTEYLVGNPYKGVLMGKGAGSVKGLYVYRSEKANISWDCRNW